MGNVQSDDPNIVTLEVRGAPGQAVDIFEIQKFDGTVLAKIASDGTSTGFGSGSGDVVGPDGATDNAVARFDAATGKLIQDSLMVLDDAGSPNILTGQTYKINGAPHTHDGVDIVTTIDGDVLPAMSESKLGAVPSTGVPSGKYLKDDGTWSGPLGSGDVHGPVSSTNLAIPKFNGTDGKYILNSNIVIDSSDNLNIPSGSNFQVDGVDLTYSDVAAAPLSHVHAGADITTGTIDGDILPTMNATKKGAVPATGTPTGLFLKDNNTWSTPTGSGDVVGPSGATDNAISRFNTATGKLLQDSLVTVDDSGSVNVPTGQHYKINNTNLAYGDVGAAAEIHAHAAVDINSGVLGGDRLPALSVTLKGGCPPTGTPSGKFLKDDATWATPTGSGDVVGPSSATDNAVARFDTTTGKLIQTGLLTVDDSGSPNIPAGQTYKINGTALTYSDVGAAATTHNQAATTITTATLDGDRLPAMSTSKKGGVPPTGTPSGLYLKDDGTWGSSSSNYVKSGADYVVYLDGGVYYAQNGLTGVVDFSNSDFMTLMTNLAGKVIYLRSGTYVLASELDMGTGWKGTVIRGAGEYNTIIMNTGNHVGFHIRSNYVYIMDLRIDSTSGGAASVAIQVGPNPGDGGSAYDTHLENLEIMDFSNAAGACLRFSNQWMYISIINVRMSTGNGVCVDFQFTTSPDGNNGQTCFVDCEMSGNYGAVMRSGSSSVGGTCERITFLRCGIYGGKYAPYMFDAIKIGDLLLSNCDFEMDSAYPPSVSMLRIDNTAQRFDSCQFSAHGSTTIVGVTSLGGASTGGVAFRECKFYDWRAGSVVFPTGLSPCMVYNPCRASFAGTLVQAGSGANVIETDPGNASSLHRFLDLTNEGAAVRYVSSVVGSPPTLATNGEVVVWHDSTNNKEYLMIRSNGGTFKMQCT